MAVDRDGLARLLREDLLEAGREAAHEVRQRLGAGDAVVLQMVQPIVGRHAEARLDLVPSATGPVAEIDLAQAGQDDRSAGEMASEGLERELHAAHRAGVERVERRPREPVRQALGLLVSGRRELHVDLAAAEDAVITGLHFAVAEEEETGGHRLMASDWAASNPRMPIFASRSSSASWSSPNVASSPAAWSSMNSPEPPITMFMSTAASLSSR